MFLAYDGDKVGRKLESLLIDNDVYKIKNFANEVWDALHTLEQQLLDKNCEIIFASGDSIFAKSNEKFDVEQIIRIYGDVTFSLGVGNTPLEAMLALKKAKSQGTAASCYHAIEVIR